MKQIFTFFFNLIINTHVARIVKTGSDLVCNFKSSSSMNFILKCCRLYVLLYVLIMYVSTIHPLFKLTLNLIGAHT